MNLELQLNLLMALNPSTSQRIISDMKTAATGKPSGTISRR